tara:strand:- start:248 stop:535 length:288 start_codon:yes stop_codon:yes gene_type:complete
MNVNDLYNLTQRLFNRQNSSNGILTKSEGATPTGETPSAGTYYAIQFITDCTPTVFTASNSTLATGVLYPAGTIMYCDVTAITGSANSIYSLYKV